MKKVLFVLTIALSFAFISNEEPTSEMIIVENEDFDQCFIDDIPDENGKCFQYCPPLWEPEEIPCR